MRIHMHTAAACVEQQSAMQARHVCLYPYNKYTYMHVNMRIMLCACNILPTPILVLEMLHQLQYHQAFYLTNTCLLSPHHACRIGGQLECRCTKLQLVLVSYGIQLVK